MVNAWVGRRSRDEDPRPIRAWTRAEQVRATRLEVRRDCARHLVDLAMSVRQWNFAAEWEEQVCMAEHELALLESARASPN
jgi:hypothetical protein